MSRFFGSVAVVLTLVLPALADEEKETTPYAKVVQAVGLTDATVGPVFFSKKGDYDQRHAFVIHNAQELVAHSMLADQAKDPTVQKLTTAWLADKFQVGGIQWDNQTVIALRQTHAQELSIGEMRREGQTLIVPYSTKGVRRCGGSAILVLVPRFDGEVKFVEETSPSTTK